MYNEFILFLGTENMESTSKFYQNILNMPLYKDQKGICKIFSISNESKIGFCSHMPVTFKEKSPIITLIVDEVDKMYKQLLDNDIEIKEPPQYNETFNIYHFFLEDPNGYTIEVQKFLD